MATVVSAPSVPPRLPLGRGRPGTVEAGVGHTPWLPVDAPVAWFRGSPTQADTEVITRAVAVGVDAGVPVVGVLSGVGVDATAGLASLHGWGALARALAGASGLVPVVLVVDGPCLGGTALVLGLVDLVVMTARATAFVNGPQASARITGSATLDADLLGGSWVHGARTGVAMFSIVTFEISMPLSLANSGHWPKVLLVAGAPSFLPSRFFGSVTPRLRRPSTA